MSSCQTRIYGSEFTREEIAEAVRQGRLLSMEIEFNQICNFRCIYCYASDNGKRTSELAPEEFRGVLQDAHDLGARKIIILGGEPMLYPQLMEMIHFIRGLGMEVELFTNGTNMTPEAARELYASKVRVVLKMNTFDESLQDTLSGRKGAHHQIQTAFANLKAAGYPSAECPMGVSSIICQQNIDELPQLWEWLRDQNVLPYFEMITPQGGAQKHNMLEIDPRTAEEFFHKIAEIDRTKYNHHWDPKPPLVGGECLRHHFSCIVNSEGYVMPCVGVTIPLGNVREHKLGEILRDSEVMQDLKAYRGMIKGPCGDCHKLEECYGCRGTAYQMTGDYLASDPTCWKNLERRDDIMFLPVDAARVVPHRPPILMLDRLLEVKERASVSEMTVRADMVFVNAAGALDEAAYPEIVSQAIAAQEGFRKLGSSNPFQEGYLLGIKNFQVLGTAQVGDNLLVAVHKAVKYGDFGIIHGEVRKGDEVIARGEIKVWQNEGKAA